MNILHRIVRKTLRKNPTRTWATIIGITLSMALTVAVLEGAFSGLKFMENVEIDTAGPFHGLFFDLDADAAERAASLSEVKDSAAWQLVGWEQNDDEADGRLPIFVDAITDDVSKLIVLHLLEGRMPENERELILPSSFFENTDPAMDGDLKARYAIGQTVTLPLGQRIAADGSHLSERDGYRAPVGEEKGESVVNAVDCTYTIVGIYSQVEGVMNNRDATGFRAFTKGTGSGEYTVLFTLHHPSLWNRFKANQTISSNLRGHTMILRFYGIGDNALVSMLYGFAGILVGLVAFGSISLIYNSFSISVSERTRQFGILKSVGATKKQTRAMVLYEALVLGGIGILLGVFVGLAGIGITLWGISPSIARMMAVSSAVRMKLIVSPLMLVISALVCLLTTIISAWIPAKRAVKLNAIEAIRQSSDVKVSAREVKVSPLTLKLFGFDGMMASKNFKRNRKRYRATVLSLFMSIVLFISASSLTAYIRDSINDFAGEASAVDIQVHCSGSGSDADTLLRELMRADAVTSGNYSVHDQFRLTYRAADLTADYRELIDLPADQTERSDYGALLFVDDAEFRAILKDNDLQADSFFTGTPQGLIVNESTESVRKDGKTVYKKLNLIEAKAFPIQVGLRMESIPDGRYLLGSYDTDGLLPQTALEQLGVHEGELAFYDDDAITALVRSDAFNRALADYEASGTFDTSIFDSEKLWIVPESEIFQDSVLTVAAPCKVNRIILPATDTILYPYSRMQEVLGAETAARTQQWITFSFRTDDHTAAASRMFEIAEANNISDFSLYDLAESLEMERLLVRIVDVFAYGFIILISLIAAANVFNTISTNIMLRRREFAMLKSIGLAEKGFRKMMNYECLIYGLKGLLWGLPASVLVTFLIWKVASDAVEQRFYIPWYSVAIAVCSVFAVVFATMLYATSKIKKDNPIDALKNENL